MMLPVLLMFLLLGFMFWSTRSQQKKQAAALSSLQKGDRVVTQSGLVGKLVEVGERYAKVEISPGVKIEMLRSGLVGKDPGEDAKKSESKSEPKSEPKKKD